VEEQAQNIAQGRREREEARLALQRLEKRKQAFKLVSNRPPKKQVTRQLGSGASGVGGREVGLKATLVSLPKVTSSGCNISLLSKFR
jgi:hypothetical protein